MSSDSWCVRACVRPAFGLSGSASFVFSSPRSLPLYSTFLPSGGRVGGVPGGRAVDRLPPRRAAPLRAVPLQTHQLPPDIAQGPHQPRREGPARHRIHGQCSDLPSGQSVPRTRSLVQIYLCHSALNFSVTHLLRNRPDRCESEAVFRVVVNLSAQNTCVTKTARNVAEKSGSVQVHAQILAFMTLSSQLPQWSR